MNPGVCNKPVTAAESPPACTRACTERTSFNAALAAHPPGRHTELTLCAVFQGLGFFCLVWFRLVGPLFGFVLVGQFALVGLGSG